jgi:cobalt-zinc-cadmium efflux system outer membrane protein
MRLRAICVGLLLSIAALKGFGAAEQAPQLTELVALAMQRNPEILAAQNNYEAAQQRPSQAASLPDPMFSPGWNSNGNPLPGAGIGSNPTSNVGFSISQEFPYAGKRRLRGNLAAKEAEVDLENVQLVQLNVAARVEQAYFRLQHSYSATEVLERNRDLLKKLLSLTEISYTSGKAAQQDVFKAQLQLSLLETKILQLQRERRLREAEINSLLDRPTQAAIGVPAEPHIAPLDRPLEELQRAARDAAPLRLRDQKAIQAAELSLHLARRESYPDATLSGGYYNMAGLPAFYSFRADIKVPLYFRSKQRAAITEQSLLTLQAHHTYEATAQSLALRIADDYSSAQTSLQLVDLYTNTVLPQARLTIDSSLVAYESGKLDFLSVLNNYTATLDYEMNYHEEMLNYHLALSRLEEATGVHLIEENHQ